MTPEAEPPSSRRFAGPWIWTIGCGFLLGILAPLALLASVPDVGRSPAWWVTTSIIVYAGWRLAILVGRGETRLFDFFFMIFVYLFLGLAPTVQIRSGEISSTTPNIPATLDMPTAMTVVAGLVVYETARLLATTILISRRSPLNRRARLPSEPSIDARRAAAMVVAGMVLAAYYVVRVGPSALFVNRTAFAVARDAAWPDPSIAAIFSALAIYPLLVGVGSMVQLWRGDRGQYSFGYLFGAILGAAALLVVVNPVRSARYPLGTVIFALVVFAGALLTSRRTRASLAATIAALIFLFPIADAFRTDTVRVARVSFFGEYLRNPDYDGFWQIANSIAYFDAGAVVPGRQLLGVLLFWMPRSLYPGKPVDTGIELAQFRGYEVTNLSAPLWAEFIVNGGLLALVLGFVLVGALVSVADSHLTWAFRTPGWWAIVGAVVPVYSLILVRGSLLQATGALVVMLLCLLLVRGRRGRPPLAYRRRAARSRPRPSRVHVG